MTNIHPLFITDAEGNRVSAVIPIKEYEALIEELEDQEDVRLFDEAMASDEPSMPIEEAIKIIESNRSDSK